MNLFQLVLKQMRQRALSSCLTTLSVLLGVALAIAILLFQREGATLFGQKDYGYDTIVGPPKGSPTQLVLNTVYQIDKSPGLFPYSLYEELTGPGQFRPYVRHAIPYAVGDSYEGLRIVGTLPKLFGFNDDGTPAEFKFEYRNGKSYELAQGRVFHARKFEAVIGSEVTERVGLKIGSKFQAAHGVPKPGEEAHVHDDKWEVVGVLKETKTAADRLIYIPLVSFYAISDHEEAMEDIFTVKHGADPSDSPKPSPAINLAPPKKDDHDDHDHDRPATAPAPAAQSGPLIFAEEPKADDHKHDDHKHDDGHDHGPTTGPATTSAAGHDHHGHDHGAEQFHVDEAGLIDLKVPKEKWMLSAVLVRSRGFIQGERLRWTLNNRDEAIAVNPALVMREFFNTFFSGTALVLLLIAALVAVVAGVGILVSIYNSVSARLREIAILRALGATRRKILALICLEAGVIGLIGGIGGLILGHVLAGVGSVFLERLLGEGIDWVKVGRFEVYYLAGVVLIAVLAGLVPALKAYRTPVATNLAGG